MAQPTRTDHDFLGEIKLPKDAYYGAQTARAMENFQISRQKAHPAFRQALGIVKFAAAQANHQLKLIPKKEAQAIFQAATEFVDGKFDDEFILDAFQAGAGTSYNMNANEIIANRANELLGDKSRTYKHIHPNNHVNMAQSTNDTIPATTRIAILLLLPALLEQIEELEKAIDKLAKKHSKLIKVGRTHLQDAVPVTFEQEFDSYKEALQKSRKFIMQTAEDLKILGIGGTAAGTGLTAHPDYHKTVVKCLGKITKIDFKGAKSLVEIANNMNSFLNFSAALRSLAINLLNFSGDLKLMASGPKAGFNELLLPAVQPGSSIMPGKINPSIPECVDMIAVQVIGNDTVVEMSCQKSQFELNVMCPVIMHNILNSMEILTNGLAMLRKDCVAGIIVQVEEIEKTFHHSLAVGTALVPGIGYEKTAEVVKKALREGKGIKDILLEDKILTEKAIDKLFSPAKLTRASRED